jgi:ATP-dependent 26S proteasome regulatory subunit
LQIDYQGDMQLNDNNKKYENLESHVKHLEKRLRNLETEKQLLDAERIRLEQELNGLRNEIDRLREPPLVGAVIVNEVPDSQGRYIVLTSLGMLFVVNASRKLKKTKLEPGAYVSLNQRTRAIMEVLPIQEEKLWKAAKKLMSHYFVAFERKKGEMK